MTETMLYGTIGKIEVKLYTAFYGAGGKDFTIVMKKIIAVIAVLITFFNG